MKPSSFTYVRPHSLAEAIGALVEHGDRARLVAGGQSLLAMLNMRLVEPEVLVDIGRLDELSGIKRDDDKLRIGALSRHADVLASPVISGHLPLISKAMPYVAHAAIRSQGTFGGSLAHADPAAELPACALALEAVLEASGPRGNRDIPADDFFQGLFETALAEDEVLVGARFDVTQQNDWSSFNEIARRHGDYAMAGLAAQGRHGEGGVFESLRLVFFAVSDRPVLAKEAARILTGTELTPDLLIEAQNVLARELEVFGDLYCDAEMKLHLSRVLLARAFNEWISP